MDAYKKAHITKAAQLIAAKLNKEDADNALFTAIAEMQCNSTVNTANLNTWAETSIEHLLDDCSDDDMCAYNFSFVELLFISEHSEEIVNFLVQ